MATFSQGFLSSLGRPAMGESLFGLGQAIGGVPGQMRQRRQQEEFNQLMQQGQAALASNDSAALSNIAQQLAASGFQKEAQQFSIASQQAALKQRQTQVLSSVDLTTPAGLTSLSEFYKQEGNIAQAVELSTAARQRQAEIDTQNRFVERKTSLANTAVRLGQKDLAERIIGIQDPEELRVIATEMRKTEVDRMPTQSPLVRKRMAQAAGIPDKVFNELDLAKVSDTTFAGYISGEKAQPEFFLKDGTVKSYRVNKESGLIWDIDQSRWAEAADLGLTEAPPQVQKIQNIAAGMGDELAKAGAKNFTEAYDNAKKAAETITSVNRSLPLVDNMFTGAAAEIKLNISRYAREFGIELANPEAIADTQVYIADSGRRLADFIRNLGSGTGISDSDRKYAEQVVAGNITVDADGLKRLLKALKVDAEGRIDSYKKIRKQVKEKLGADAEAALAFFGEDFYIGGPVPVRSGAATSFLDAASQ